MAWTPNAAKSSRLRMPDAGVGARSAAMTAADIHAAILAAWRIEQPRLITSLSRMLREDDLTNAPFALCLLVVSPDRQSDSPKT